MSKTLKSVDAELQKLKSQQAKLNKRINEIESKRKAKAQKRELARKALVGGYYLELAKRDGKLDELHQQMLGYLKREKDRALFLPTEEDEYAEADPA